MDGYGMSEPTEPNRNCVVKTVSMPAGRKLERIGQWGKWVLEDAFVTMLEAQLAEFVDAGLGEPYLSVPNHYELERCCAEQQSGVPQQSPRARGAHVTRAELGEPQ